MSKIKIGVVISTTRPTRVGPSVARWFMSKSANYDNADFELIDLKQVDLPFLADDKSPADNQYNLESTKRWSSIIQGFDGFVFITAEYNNGYPAPLKNALDTIYNEWDKKPVAFVGYGTYGGVRSIEQLVSVTAKLGMVPLAKTVVGILSPWKSVDSEGRIDSSYIHGRVEVLLDNLLWWARKLRVD